MFGPPPEIVTGWSNIIFSAVSIAISYLLYRLYGQQKDLLAANHRARVTGEVVESNQLTTTVELNNYGNGMAENLSLETLVDLPEPHSNKYGMAGNRLKPADSNRVEDAIIESGEKNKQFETKPIVSVSDPSADRGVRSSRLFEAISEMRDDGVDEVRICFAISYSDLTGKSDIFPVTPFVMEINPQEERYAEYLQQPPQSGDFLISREEFSDVFDYPEGESWDSVSRLELIKYRITNVTRWVAERNPGLTSSGD